MMCVKTCVACEGLESTARHAWLPTEWLRQLGSLVTCGIPQQLLYCMAYLVVVA
jgi:hypothetical protein